MLFRSGSPERVNQAFGKEPANFIREIAKLPEDLLPPSFSKIWDKRNFFYKASKIGLKTDNKAPVLSETIQNADLTQLPALTSWPKDGGPFLTLPLVHTQSKTAAKADNLGIYRVQIFKSNEAGMHFQIGKGGGFHLHESEVLGQNLPANIYLGGPPALMLSAIAPLPENVPELMLASLLLQGKLSQGKLETPNIAPIAECEFAILGSIPANIRKPEGPFGDHYGYYSLKHNYPIFIPEKIYHRKNAIFPATIVGKPRQEDYYLGDYIQELLSPLFPLVMPAVEGLWSYGQTGYHCLSVARLKERYQRESMMSVFRILGEGQLSLTKFLIALDKPCDLKDFKSVLKQVLARVDWRKDLFIFSELSMDSLDYSGPKINEGSKGVMLGFGEPIRELPSEFRGTEIPNFIKSIKPYCPGCLVVEVPSYSENQDCVKEISSWSGFKDWPLIVAVDSAERACQSDTSFLWTTFTRFEPAQDIHPASCQIFRHKLMYEGPITIDARMKSWYPEELFCDPDTKKRVSDRWNEYFPNKNVEMGSSDWAHL